MLATADTVTVTIPATDRTIDLVLGHRVRFRARAVSSTGEKIGLWGIGDSPKLAPNLSINAWGLVRGLPKAVGTYTIWVSAFDAPSYNGGSASFTLVVTK